MIMVVKNFISDHVQYSSLWTVDMALIRIQSNPDKEAVKCIEIVVKEGSVGHMK
jgi:hypothetical protein